MEFNARNQITLWGPTGEVCAKIAATVFLFSLTFLYEAVGMGSELHFFLEHGHVIEQI